MDGEKGAISSYTRWICSSIKSACKKHGGRPGGSAGAKGATRDMLSIARGFADEAELHPFTMHPKAFIGSFGLGAFFDIIGVNFFILFLIYPYPVLSFLSFLMFFLSILVVLLEFFLYLPFTDKFYPAAKSENLFLVRKAKETSQRKIIFVGHSDSAYELPFVSKRPRALFVTVIIGAEISKITGLILGILFTFSPLAESLYPTLIITECVMLIFLVPFLFFVNWDAVTDGANDNLTGCYLALSVMKEMSDRGERLNNTDLCCLITDGEESGLRGAMAFAKKNRDRLRAENALVIAVDTVHDPSEIMVYDRGINFTQKNGKRATELLRRAGEALGIKIPTSPFYPGATDAEAFSRAGVEAAAICAVSHGVCDYYHTKSDNADNLSECGIEITRRVLLNAAKIYDAEEII